MQEEIKERLLRHISFLEKELEDYSLFQTLDWVTYNTNRSKRRDVERWIENIVNSSIDISKLILNAEEITLPETYREIVSFVGLVEGFKREEIEKVAQWVGFRNIVAHEYLDIRWNLIKKFIQETDALYKGFLKHVKFYLKKKLEKS